VASSGNGPVVQDEEIYLDPIFLVSVEFLSQDGEGH
jgi:hypothetical protein